MILIIIRGKMKDTERQRDTKQRRMIYEAVLRRSDHPDADQIYLDVNAIDRKISKATVYRNLRVLSENGLIAHVRMPGADRYDLTLKRHYHMICAICGRVTDAPINYAEENDRLLESKTGFRITRHQTIFEGICPECLAAPEKPRGAEETNTGDE